VEAMQVVEKASSINEIAKAHARLAQSKGDLVTAEVRHNALENEYGKLLEQFVVATAQQAGLMRLPPAVIQAGIRYLAIAGTDPALVAEWNALPGVVEASNVSTNAQADTGRSAKRRPRRPGPGQALVSVKISKREGKKCVPSLRDAGLKWDGKHIDFRGIVDASDVEMLRARFPNCVIVDGQDQIDDVLNGEELDGIAGAVGNPLTTPEPSPTDIDAGLTSGSDDPQFATKDPQPPGEADEAGSEALDEEAKSKSEDVGLPQVTRLGPRSQTRQSGISAFSRLPARPAPKGS
jgi:hypothetical protein